MTEANQGKLRMLKEAMKALSEEKRLDSKAKKRGLECLQIGYERALRKAKKI